MDQAEWLTINFTLPKEPSRTRVSVWRKLKRAGSVNIGQSIWVLPPSDEHYSFFEEIAAEVEENNGEAYIMKSYFTREKNIKIVCELFNEARNEEYKEFLGKCEDFFQEIEKETAKMNFTFAEIEENEHELEKLNIWLKRIIERDFFNASLQKESRNMLDECKERLSNYSNKVYELSCSID
ncbi:MAG: chromate resistance protein ChrB [Peptococcaceae bacterium]|nr:chromate resistance protein ChrB [Peptococcaceae bacterium]